jgi:hypothetical protein
MSLPKQVDELRKPTRISQDHGLWNATKPIKRQTQHRSLKIRQRENLKSHVNQGTFRGWV